METATPLTSCLSHMLLRRGQCLTDTRHGLFAGSGMFNGSTGPTTVLLPRESRRPFQQVAHEFAAAAAARSAPWRYMASVFSAARRAACSLAVCMCMCVCVCVCFRLHDARPSLNKDSVCVCVCVCLSVSLSLSLSLSFSLAVELTTRSRQHCVSETAWDCSACVYDTAHHSETSDTSATTI